MTSAAARACVRCHSKKIKCDGVPDCRTCRNVGITCVPHIRTSKREHLELLKEAKKRVHWLESEISRFSGIDCQNVRTGSRLETVHNTPNSVQHNLPQIDPVVSEVCDDSNASFAQGLDNPEDLGDSPSGRDTAEISLLALNATGDVRYLGPSSGSFFAAYAASLVRACGLNQRSDQVSETPNRRDVGPRPILADVQQPLSEECILLLLRSYQMWLQPLYPLLRAEYITGLVTRCGHFQSLRSTECNREPEHDAEMAIFYLVMALGATNLANTLKELKHIRSAMNNETYTYIKKISPTYLYSKAIDFFDGGSHSLRPNLLSIRSLLLISIYSSYGSTGASQWQLAGLAMRMSIEIGLHSAPQAWPASSQAADDRNRTFWTAYAIEISLAYNLGRPPSVAEQHVSADLPSPTPETSLAIHHLKHRQIQSKIVSQVYFASSTSRTNTAESIPVIASLQQELNEWHAALAGLKEDINLSAYPYSYWQRLYHGTSFVLHRSSPLCPHPSPSSTERCIRSAGAYIEDMLVVLRNSNVPLSWMLVQGVLFAGLTMLVSIKTGAQSLASSAGVAFLLVKCPSWTRKCSVCLAVMNERLHEDLLVRLEAQFETLANDVLTTISKNIMSYGSNPKTPSNQPIAGNDMGTAPGSEQALDGVRPEISWHGTGYMDNTMLDDWQNLEPFREYLGFDGTQSFWDVFPPPVDMGFHEPMQWI